MQRVIDYLELLRRLGQRLGPYLLVEILLPGGSLFALMLFLYQRRKAGTGRALPQPLLALARAFASLAPQALPVLQPCYASGPSRVVRATVDNPE
jgi:hypothetical protein